MDRDFTEPRPQRDSLFGWTVFILLLIAFAFTCWIGTYYLFGRPENPKSYQILRKLKKLEPLKRFELTAAPTGEFLTAQKLFDRYATMSRLDLDRENSELLRGYLQNYTATKKLLPYVVGRYVILDTNRFSANTIFPSGIVALAQSTDNAQVLIEHAFTCDGADVPSLERLLQKGLDFKLERTLDLSVIIHVEKLQTGHILFTCVPLLYGSYQMRQGSGKFSLQPPPDLNMEAGVPVLKTPEIQEAIKAFASTRQQSAPSKLSANPQPSATPAGPELVRVDPTPTPTPVETPTPVIARATPVRPAATPVPMPTGTPINVAANTTPTPLPTPVLTPTATVTPSPISPDGVPLQPFLQAVATPNTRSSAARSWKTYPPGKMPLGKLVGVDSTGELAERGVGGETIYLRGEFTVTASGDNRAVLRAKTGGLSNIIKPGAGGTRIIAEYPAGMTPPTEGAAFERGQDRPFQITDVRKGADGQINIYVREVTSP